jgi:dTDP-4-dehydrorhamnose 3,5-epimerase
MNFTPLKVAGAFGISSAINSDFRGSLTRLWDLNSSPCTFNLIQSSIVRNPTSGTLRGLHFQSEPFAENKVVECVGGRVFDVLLDLRVESPTSGEHLALEIGFGCEYLGVFVPAGCAHGYITLEANSTLVYFMDKTFAPEHSSGIRWNDPAFEIVWPSAPRLISEIDANWPSISQ